MTGLFKPMLAGKYDDELQRYPLMLSAKIDGVRGTVVNGVLRSRSLKEFKNKHVQALFSNPEFNGLDGEFVVGSASAADSCRATTSTLNRIEGEPAVTFWVFDDYTYNAPYAARYASLAERTRRGVRGAQMRVLTHEHIRTEEDLENRETHYTRLGFEGVMVRDPFGAYKFGRSTAKEGGLLKVKRFEDMEARVLRTEEEMHNGNVATVSELGRSKRSSHAANKTGKGTMGACVCVGLNGPFKDVEFNVGSGFDAPERAMTDWVGQIIKVKYFAVGVKDRPRHPVFLGRRMAEDMS